MIAGKAIYDVLVAVVRLYVAMILGYGSVRWWKILTPEQCSGISRFVSVFAVPLLSFNLISSNNPYTMNFFFIAADSLQKVVVLLALVLWQVIVRKRNGLDWMITVFSLSTQPNTLVMGIPLLKAMYGDFSGSLMVQVVVFQCTVWYTLLIFLYEYRGAKHLICENFADNAAAIGSCRVESDVVSLGVQEDLETDAEVGDDGKLHVVVRRSCSSRSNVYLSHGMNETLPRARGLTGVEIYSVTSSRTSSFSQNDVVGMIPTRAVSLKNGEKVFALQSPSKVVMPRVSSIKEDVLRMGSIKQERSASGESGNNGSSVYLNSYPNSKNVKSKMDNGSKEVPSLETGNPRSDTGFGRMNSSKIVPQWENVAPKVGNSSPGEQRNGDHREIKIEDGTCHGQKNVEKLRELDGQKNKQIPAATVMTKLALVTVWRKLIRNPNTYASVLGLLWSLLSYRWNFEMPAITKGCITIVSDTGLGLANFSLGLFMGLQPKIIACGYKAGAMSMVVRFLVGPAVMAATSSAIGIRGFLLHVAIIQAALPEGIVPFVFAKEYNVHTTILSTAVIFGMMIALPITIMYYVLLEL